MLFLRFFLFPISYFLYSLPRLNQVQLSRAVGNFLYSVIKVRREVVESNLRIAFPNWSQEKINEIARKSYHNLALNIFEYLILFHFKKSDFDKYFFIESLASIEKSFESKKGSLLISLHMGAIHFALVGMAIARGSIGATLKIRGLFMKTLVEKVCLKFGVIPVADRRNPFDIFRLLKKNIPVCFIMDQYMGNPHGILVKFFNYPAGTAAGLAAFSMRTKLPVIPAYNFRRDDGKIVICSMDPIPLEESMDKDLIIPYMTQKYNDKLEEIIRKYPEQWFWVHKRWKVFS